MKLSLSKVLHNEKVLLIVSLMLSVIIWVLVTYGPNNEESRTVTQVPVTVSLGSYAQEQGLRIVGGDAVTATVTVYGRRSAVEWLSAADMTLTVNTGTIVQSGTYDNLAIQATKNNSSADYEVVDIAPRALALTVDYWETRTFAVEADAAGVTAQTDGLHRIGALQLDSAAFVGNTITVEGPRRELERIDAVVARVSEKRVLSETAAFTAALVALDADGGDADIPHCTFINPSNSEVTVTVPVEEFRTVTLTGLLKNVPAGLSGEASLTVTPSQISLWGTPQAISEFVAQNTEKFTYDITALTADSLPHTETLVLSDEVELGEPIEQVEVASPIWETYTLDQRRITLPLTADNVTFVNLPAGKTAELQSAQWVTVTVCGVKDEVAALTAEDLAVTVDLERSTDAAMRYPLTVSAASGRVWVCADDTLTARVRVTG